MKPAFLPLCLLVAVVACKKDRSHTHAAGVMTDTATQARVASAWAYLLPTKRTSLCTRLYASASQAQPVEAGGRQLRQFGADEHSQYRLRATAPPSARRPKTGRSAS